MEEKRILQIENAPRADVAAPREKKKKARESAEFQATLGIWLVMKN